jgi:predicted DNA-binding transcriptional regulator AlpA
MATATVTRAAAAAKLPQVVPLAEVVRTFGVQRQTIRLWIRRGEFPPPLPFSRVRLCWNRADVEAVVNGSWTPPGKAKTKAGKK